MIKMLQYKMYPAGELAVLRQLLLSLANSSKLERFSLIGGTRGIEAEALQFLFQKQ